MGEILETVYACFTCHRARLLQINEDMRVPRRAGKEAVMHSKSCTGGKMPARYQSTAMQT